MHLKIWSLWLLLAYLGLAAPVKSLVLDTLTFKERTARGTWIVKHFSPQCKHCRSFQPKWEQVLAGNSLDVSFGEINCLENEALCDSHKVTSWPTIVVFQDGQQQPHALVGDETVEALQSFISRATRKFAENSVVLNSQNYTQYAHRGVWLVKHYSPFCPHCRRMAPHWKRLADELADKFAEDGIWFGEVNCIENGKLCEDNLVDGYPTVNLFVDGRFIEEMLIKYEYPVMKEYMLKLPQRVRSGELAAKKDEPVVANDNRDWDDMANDAVDVAKPVTSKAVVEAPSPNAIVETVSKPADPAPANAAAAAAASELEEQYNVDGQVVVLTKENFAEKTATGPWFVEFYAPWCPHCQHLAPEWERLGAAARGKINIGKVDCDEAGQLCSDQNVQGFPTLKLIWEGQSLVYKGPRELENMHSFAQGMLAQPRVIKEAEQMQQMRHDNDVVFMFHGDSNGDAVKRISTNVRKMFMAGQLGIVADAKVAKELAGDSYKKPMLAVFKDGRSVVYGGSLASDDAIREWLYAERFPLLPEFTRENADSLFYDSDFLVLGVLPTDAGRSSLDASRETVRSAAVEYQKYLDKSAQHPEQGSKVRFAWIDGPKWSSYVERVFQIPQSEWPSVVIVQSSEDQFYTLDISGRKIEMSKLGIFMAVRAAVDGKLKPQSTKSILVRGAKVIGHMAAAIWAFFFGSILSTLVTIAGIALLAYIVKRTRGAENRNGFNLVKAD
ncbi:hypothetical protein LPJ55_002019 [Coemansia sp. RSA 990]|nr:hypothetical protein LPJ55_002019 [Coemansia sp. RSA 990]